MENPNLIIFTVGTSLLMRNKSKYKSVRGCVKKQLGSANENAIKNGLDRRSDSYYKFFDVLLTVNPSGQIKKRGSSYDAENNPDNLPAELSSLYLFYFPSGNIPDTNPSKVSKDKVAFLYSPDNECIFCAYCVMKYLQEKFYRMIDKNIIMKKIDELDPKDKEKFEKEGMRKLLSEISKLITDYKDSHNIILNITGGYKGAVPYLTLLGMCHEGVEVIYLFEESKANIALPKMPVAFDLPTWRDFRGFINTIPKLDEKQVEMIKKVLLPQVRGLFDGKELNALGKEFNERYAKEKIILTPFGRGYLLTEKISNNKIKKYLQVCINQWQHIWIGDKIPEMVEHARGHTQRVLELAAQLVYPILEDESQHLFDDTKLASLIGAIWLHDLGNSGERFKLDNQEYVIKGFPSLIRDFHNLVTATILEEDEQKIFPSEVEIGDEEKIKRSDVENTVETIIKNIKTISKYHREWTPLTQGKVCEKGKHCIKINEPIADYKLQFLTALYRVLDACDTQLERTVDKAYIKTRKMTVDWEVKILIEEKERLESNPKINNFMVGLNKAGYKKCSDIDLNLLKGNLDWIFKEDKNTEKQINKYADCINSIVGRVITCQEETSDPVKRWLSYLDQIFFKKRQPLHYEKHEGIDAVMILYELKEDNVYKFNIRMVGAEDTPEQKLKDTLKKDIISEYVEVKEILDSFIKFKFSYQCYNLNPQIYKDYNDFDNMLKK